MPFRPPTGATMSPPLMEEVSYRARRPGTSSKQIGRRSKPGRNSGLLTKVMARMPSRPSAAISSVYILQQEYTHSPQIEALSDLAKSLSSSGVTPCLDTQECAPPRQSRRAGQLYSCTVWNNGDSCSSLQSRAAKELGITCMPAFVVGKELFPGVMDLKVSKD